jgi:hypothetical protein
MNLKCYATARARPALRRTPRPTDLPATRFDLDLTLAARVQRDGADRPGGARPRPLGGSLLRSRAGVPLRRSHKSGSSVATARSREMATPRRTGGISPLCAERCGVGGDESADGF